MSGFAIAFVAMAVGGFTIGIIGRKATEGTLRPNRWAGIRTPYTYSSDEAWYATHRHAGPILERAGFAIAVASLILLVLGMAGVFGPAVAAIGALALTAVMLTAAIAAWWIGTSRARRELGQP